jgi:hypothetical protein
VQWEVGQYGVMKLQLLVHQVAIVSDPLNEPAPVHVFFVAPSDPQVLSLDEVSIKEQINVFFS